MKINILKERQKEHKKRIEVSCDKIISQTQTKWVKIWIYLFYMLLTVLILTLSIIRHATSSLFNFIETLTISLSIASIATWIKIVIKGSYYVQEDGNMSTGMKDIIFSQIVNLRDYRSIWSILLILIFINLMQYLTFSNKLTRFYRIISAAISNITFFVIMILCSILAYALIGHLIFGINDENFHTFTEAIFTMLMVLIGQISMFNTSNLYTVYRNIFGFSFILLSVL